jgi:hypothetical protein
VQNDRNRRRKKEVNKAAKKGRCRGRNKTERKKARKNKRNKDFAVVSKRPQRSFFSVRDYKSARDHSHKLKQPVQTEDAGTCELTPDMDAPPVVLLLLSSRHGCCISYF